MNTRQVGDFSELLVLTELASRGLRVAIPYGNCQDFDLLLLHSSNRWVTIQVKTAHRRGARGGSIYVDTIRGSSAHKKRGYEEGAFEYLIAVLPNERLFWVIPFAEMQNRRCISLPETRLPNWELL